MASPNHRLLKRSFVISSSSGPRAFSSKVTSLPSTSCFRRRRHRLEEDPQVRYDAFQQYGGRHSFFHTWTLSRSVPHPALRPRQRNLNHARPERWNLAQSQVPIDLTSRPTPVRLISGVLAAHRCVGETGGQPRAGTASELGRRARKNPARGRNLKRGFRFLQWAWVDLNYRPHAYQACALTS